MDKKKSATELCSTAITEAVSALAGAGFSILGVACMDTFGGYVPDSVKLGLTIVKETPSS
jgi:hypothetical protein